jgi:hypothetical protein
VERVIAEGIATTIFSSMPLELGGKWKMEEKGN